MSRPAQLWFLENIDAQDIFCPQKTESHAVNNVVFEKNEFVFKQNELSDNIYFIKNGRIKIGTENHDHRSMTKAILNSGEVFGEKTIIGEYIKRDFAQAMEKTEVCVMSKDEMTSLYREHSSIYLFLMNLVGNRALEMEKRLESLIFKDSRSRIIEFLIEFVNKKGQQVGYEWVIRKFITHQEIANLTATSRQTVTTVLNDLKTNEILTFNRKRLLIRDLDKLTGQLSLVP